MNFKLTSGFIVAAILSGNAMAADLMPHKGLPINSKLPPNAQACQKEVQAEIASFEKNFAEGKKKGVINAAEEKSLLAAHDALKAMDAKANADGKLTAEECKKVVTAARNEHTKLMQALKPDAGTKPPLGKPPVVEKPPVGKPPVVVEKPPVGKPPVFVPHKPVPVNAKLPPNAQACQREVQAEIASFEKNFALGKTKGVINAAEEKSLLAAHENLKAMDAKANADGKLTAEECKTVVTAARAEHTKLMQALKTK